jgi:cysteine desulfurase
MCENFVARMAAHVPGVALNGHPTERLPGNIAMSVDGVEPLALMHRLNQVASFSASSACATDKVKTSDVLLAMFGDTQRARGSFRISPGRSTSETDLNNFGDALANTVAQLRRYAA